MSIEHAILGILSWQPSTGYELKKVFEESSFMYWSGNNNQIYKALIKMQEEELVTSEVIHQESSPSKKVYTISEKGLKKLKTWVLSSPEVPESKKTFLVQLAWSDILSHQEINECLSRYENELKLHLALQQEKARRSLHSPKRTPRESLIWEMISENIISTYSHELNWVQEACRKLHEHQLIEEKDKMNYQVRGTENKKYIELISIENRLNTENDTLDLISLCWEHELSRLMLHYAALSEDFFDLKTGVAGGIIQKFSNYGIKIVLIVPQETMQKGRFREMAAETNKGNHFRMYENKEEAETWLLE